MNNVRPSERRSVSAVFCVGSPLQFLCAMEAKARIGADVNALVIREPGRARNEHRLQMQLLLDQHEWTTIQYWPAPKLPGTVGLYLSARQASHIVQELPGFCDTYVLGGFGQLRGQLLRSQLRPRSTIAIDDGTSTLRHLEYYYSQGKSCPDFIERMLEERSLRGALKRWMLRLDRSMLDSPVELFTGFDIHPDQSGSINVVRHHFEELKKSRTRQEVCSQSVFYFGSPFSERKILDFAVEMYLVKEISSYYIEQGLDFTYISHRDDSSEKLTFLKGKGIACLSLGMPVELYFATSQQIPGCIASITSTALFNVSCIVDGVKAEAFPIMGLLKDERKRSHKRALLQFSRAGISVTELFENFDPVISSAA